MLDDCTHFSFLGQWNFINIFECDIYMNLIQQLTKFLFIRLPPILRRGKTKEDFPFF